MTSYESEEVAREFLARLPQSTGDATRAERTRRRCRALLEQQQHRRERADAGIALARPVLRPIAVGVFCAFCVAYVGALVATAWLLQGPFG